MLHPLIDQLDGFVREIQTLLLDLDERMDTLFVLEPALAGGARTLRMFGREFPIEAEVVQLQSFSGHADADEILRWMSAGPAPEMTYLTHGEPVTADTLRFRVEHELGRSARVPEHLESVYLDRPR